MDLSSLQFADCINWKIRFRLSRAAYTREKHRHVYKVRHLGGDADCTEIRMYLRRQAELSILIGANAVAIINRVLNKYLNGFFFYPYLLYLNFTKCNSSWIIIKVFIFIKMPQPSLSLVFKENTRAARTACQIDGVISKGEGKRRRGRDIWLN